MRANEILGAGYYKVRAIGIDGFCVTLPADFLKRNKLQKGSILHFVWNEKELIITPKNDTKVVKK